ncbi:MAG: hypothetical protein VKI83_03570 [Synechococcaceae cyanobacterium]|nr:hypothetical protein [Synechococcaceae cyanobacterium]
MAPGCFLETNVLLDAASIAPQERARRDLAPELLQEDDWTQSIQVLQEVFVQATRASRAQPLSDAEARGCSLLLSEDLSDGNATARCWCAIRSVVWADPEG